MPFIVTNTQPENDSKSTLRHCFNPNPESLVVGGVTVAGDAAHPTTTLPAWGKQGGCMALEDAFVLTQKLHAALTTTNGTTSPDEHEIR